MSAYDTLRALRRELVHRLWVTQLFVIAGLVATWEIAARQWIDPQFLSPPSRVALSLRSLFATEGVPAALLTTLWELALAFVIAAAVGLAVGLALGLSRLSRRSFMPIILLLYGTPQITIMPLFVLYFGIGPASKIAFGVSHGIFPIIVTVVAGVQNLKPILVVAARAMGANRWQVFRWVIFPHMIPSFFVGLRLGMTGVLLGVLLAELYVSSAGIGYFTQMFTDSFDPTKLLGLISLLAIMAITFNGLLRRAERHFQRWRIN